MGVNRLIATAATQLRRSMWRINFCRSLPDIVCPPGAKVILSLSNGCHPARLTAPAWKSRMFSQAEWGHHLLTKMLADECLDRRKVAIGEIFESPLAVEEGFVGRVGRDNSYQRPDRTRVCATNSAMVS